MSTTSFVSLVNLINVIVVIVLLVSVAFGQVENPSTESTENLQVESGNNHEESGVDQTKGPETTLDKVKEIEAHAEKLIIQLGDADYETRDRAEEELQRIAVIVRGVLERATKSDDPEIAGRAMVILASLPKPDHTIVDALGKPIPFAEVTIDITYSETSIFPGEDFEKMKADNVEKQLHLEVLSDDRGGVAIGDFDRAQVTILVSSETHGTARLHTTIPARDKVLSLPLVEKGSAAFERAAKGRVVNSKGKPIARAKIDCSTVRTPGEGLIQAGDRLPVVLTDEEGRFAYYLPSKKDERRGELIPENSNYRLTATMADSKSLVPVGAICNNKKESTLTLETESMLHRFAFESLDGKKPTERELVSEFVIVLKGTRDGKSTSSQLDSKAATTGIRLVPGTYTAYRAVNGKPMHYLPLEVTENSHELLTFKLPPPTTYRGRLVNGVSGEPIKDGFLIAYSSTGQGSLSMLTDDDWKVLKTIESNTDLASDKLESIRNCYGLDGIVRTRADGTFKLVQPPNRQTYGLIAFDEGMIPFKIRGFYLKDKETGKIRQHDYPLFPVAKLLVHPVHEGHRLGVSPRWLIDDEGQPDWFERFRDATESTHGEYEYSGWMPLNKPSPVFVPAGLKLRVRFRTPYSEGIAPFTIPEMIKLSAGETKDYGEIRFKRTLPGVVRVVDTNGTPVEGVPVRRLHNDERSWSIAHNTDAEGKVTIGLNPNSSGRFRAGETFGDGKVEPEFVDFSVKELAPTNEFEIKLSDEKIRKILQR